MKGIMNSEKDKRYLIDDKGLPIVLVHGTMGKSEDWSRVCIAAEYPESGPFACTRFRFQRWKRSTDEPSVQTVASLGEHR